MAVARRSLFASSEEFSLAASITPKRGGERGTPEELLRDSRCGRY